MVKVLLPGSSWNVLNPNSEWKTWLTEEYLLKALIFDFDGLILDTETPDMEAWRDIFSEHGQEFSMRTWGQIVGGSGTTNYDPAIHLEELVGHPLDRQALNKLARQRSDEAILLQPILPGACELLEQARSGNFRLAIASSSPHAWVDYYLQRLQLLVYFEAILCADDVIRTKPDPGLYLAAMNALQIHAKETVAFEDSPNGIRAAQAAGIFTVAVPIPLTRFLGVEHADLVLNSLEMVSLDDLKKRVA